MIALVLQPGAANDEGLAGGTAGSGGQQTSGIMSCRDHLLQRHAAQVLLRADGYQVEIDGAADVPGMQPVPVEERPVVRHVLVGMHQQPAQLGVAELCQLPTGAPQVLHPTSARDEPAMPAGSWWKRLRTSSRTSESRTPCAALRKVPAH